MNSLFLLSLGNYDLIIYEYNYCVAMVVRIKDQYNYDGQLGIVPSSVRIPILEVDMSQMFYFNLTFSYCLVLSISSS